MEKWMQAHREIRPVELQIYDFDGTLYNSRLPVDSSDTSWWYSARSLSGYGPPGFDHRWNLHLVGQARMAQNAPWVKTVVLTGRPLHAEMQREITNMLRTADLHFDHIQLKPVVGSQVPTSVYKAGAVRSWVLKEPSIRKVVLYEDEPENIEAVRGVVTKLGRQYLPVQV